MSEHFDARETRSPAERERDLFERLPALVAAAVRAPGWRAHLVTSTQPASTVRLRCHTSRAAQGQPAGAAERAPPFGGLLPDAAYSFGRLFTSPGHLRAGGASRHPWRAARACSPPASGSATWF